jgi:ferrous iron transport protein B
MAASIIIWFLMSIPFGVEDPRDSLFGRTSAAIAPVFTPAGFGEWEATGALVMGFVAKEVVVSTMSQVYVGAVELEEPEEPTTFLQDLGEIVVGFGQATVDTVRATLSLIPGVNLMEAEDEAEDTALSVALQQRFGPLQAVALSVFVLLYVPCMAALGAMRQEYGTRWMLFGAGYLTALGWVLATLIYQGGRALGLG